MAWSWCCPWWITKLTETWKAEQRAFAARDLSSVDYVCIWADGIHVNIRLDELLMVMVGGGDKWLAEEAGPPVLYRHHACGKISRVDPRCAYCGEPMHPGDIDLLPRYQPR